MNYSSAIFLVNPDAKLVNVSYEQTPDGKGVEPFVPFKSLDPNLSAGMFVVIPTDTRHKMTVVRVERIAGAEAVDLESGVQLKWIVCPVDSTDYDAIVKQELVAIERIKSAEARSKREELAKKLMADNPDLKALGELHPAPGQFLTPPDPVPAPAPGLRAEPDEPF